MAPTDPARLFAFSTYASKKLFSIYTGLVQQTVQIVVRSSHNLTLFVVLDNSSYAAFSA
jgi:hypothetical protein